MFYCTIKYQHNINTYQITEITDNDQPTVLITPKYFQLARTIKLNFNFLGLKKKISKLFYISKMVLSKMVNMGKDHLCDNTTL